MSSVQILASPPAHDPPQLRCGWAGQAGIALASALGGTPASLRLGVGHRHPFKLFFYLSRSQDPTHPSAPQEVTDSSKVAEPLGELSHTFPLRALDCASGPHV